MYVTCTCTCNAASQTECLPSTYTGGLRGTAGVWSQASTMAALENLEIWIRLRAIGVVSRHAGPAQLNLSPRSGPSHDPDPRLQRSTQTTQPPNRSVNTPYWKKSARMLVTEARPRTPYPPSHSSSSPLRVQNHPWHGAGDQSDTPSALLFQSKQRWTGAGGILVVLVQIATGGECGYCHETIDIVLL
jgi:hypothetical protein